MFGMVEAIYSYIMRQIGLRNDAADAAGSMHAKIGDIKNTLNVINDNVYPVHKKTPTFTRGVMQSLYVEEQWYTMVNITGNRIIVNGSLSCLSQSSYVYINILVDDVQILDTTWVSLSTFSNPEYGYTLPYDYTNDASNPDQIGVFRLDGIHFSESFKIQAMSNNGNYNYPSLTVGMLHIPA